MTSVSSSSHAESSRSATQLRPITIKPHNIIGQCHGSASFGHGHETALAAVNGPMEVRIRDELTDRATLEMQLVPLDGSAGITASSFSTTLQSALSSILLLQLYPRSLIQLTLQSTNHANMGTLPPNMHATLSRPFSTFHRRTIRPHLPHPDAALGASHRAALVNAAMMGIIAAGIQAKATLCAVAIAVVPAEMVAGTRRRKVTTMTTTTPTIVVDPSPLEESVALSTHVFAFAIFGTQVGQGDSHTQAQAQAKLALVQSSGETDWQVYRECVALARIAAKDIRTEMRAALERQYRVSEL